ncbi:MAG: cation transporter [Ruminococcus sp.]|nr:cation transporter [Ruminococcus sp.]
MKKKIEAKRSHSTVHISSSEFEKTAVKVSVVSIVGNAFLSLFKMFAGIFSHSGAMVSDAVHSASDVFSSIIVIIGVKISSKDSDKDHPYGHERFECVAAIVLAVILLVSGLFIGHNAVEQIASADMQTIAIPGILALFAAVVSIILKEAMYWYTRFYAKRFDSGALMADAWHHRSDSLSSIGALIGIAGARMGFPILDTIASLVIVIFIVKAACDIFKDAVNKMVDRSCSEETEREIAHYAAEQDGVLGVDLIHTRLFGNKIYVDLEICAKRELTLEESNEIANRVHDAIEEKFTKVKHIMVRVKPSRKDFD